MPKTGKNPSFTYEELEFLGMVVSRISARFSQLMIKYPPKRFLKAWLSKSNSARSKLVSRLLYELVNNPDFRENRYERDLRLFITELSQDITFDETDIISDWGNKGKGLSTKERTAIMKQLTERGIAENIIGKDKIEKSTSTRLKENGGYPSLYLLAHEPHRIIQLLSERRAVEFIINSLSNSQLLFIIYWYMFSSIFYFIRDSKEAEIKQFLNRWKNIDSNFEEPEFFQDKMIKSKLSLFTDQELLEFTKQLTSQVITSDAVNVSRHFLFIIALYKLNRTL